MVRCFHESCSREHRIWLPKTITSLENTRTASSNGKSDVSLHYWCVLCGCVQNISDDRPKKIGYWIDILSKIAKKHLITQSQKRLIIKELESNEYFDDIYGTTGSSQEEIFVKTIQKYCKFPENTISSFIF